VCPLQCYMTSESRITVFCTPFTQYNRLSNRFNRLSNRVVQPVWQPVVWQPVVWQPAAYTIPPVVKPVWQPVECLYTRYNRFSNRLDNRFDNRLNRVNGALETIVRLKFPTSGCIGLILYYYSTRERCQVLRSSCLYVCMVCLSARTSQQETHQEMR